MTNRAVELLQGVSRRIKQEYYMYLIVLENFVSWTHFVIYVRFENSNFKIFSKTSKLFLTLHFLVKRWFSYNKTMLTWSMPTWKFFKNACSKIVHRPFQMVCILACTYFFLLSKTLTYVTSIDFNSSSKSFLLNGTWIWAPPSVTLNFWFIILRRRLSPIN